MADLPASDIVALGNLQRKRRPLIVIPDSERPARLARKKNWARA
jgi:hypothetical protein